MVQTMSMAFAFCQVLPQFDLLKLLLAFLSAMDGFLSVSSRPR